MPSPPLVGFVTSAAKTVLRAARRPCNIEGMLLTITCAPGPDTDWPATDLGFLLHKNPDRAQTFDQSFGTAHVLYPEASEDRCTVALLLEVDPIRLVRGRSRTTPDFSLGQYVNDRPYAASSLLSVALGDVFRTALRGRCAQRPTLADTPIPLRVDLPALPCRGGVETAERVFAPLGWTVEATPLPLDPAFPEWGDSHYLRLVLTGTMRLSDALSHLYVLLPVLDGAKHYWVAADEVDKLIRAGSGWLAAHPERGWITRRYLARRHSLVRTALARLAEVDDAAPEDLDAIENTADTDEPIEEPTVSLATRRRAAVVAALHDEAAHRILDLGCGEGALLRDLLADKTFTDIVGVDVSVRSLNIARRRLRVDRMPERVAHRLTLRQGALTYTDPALRGYDAAVLMEVIEHVDPPRLGALEHAVFATAAPATVVVTTPNSEVNVLFDGLSAGSFRHGDHRFEWTRAEFADWAHGVAARRGYQVRFVPIGDEHPEHGAPTQMAVFTQQQGAA